MSKATAEELCSILFELNLINNDQWVKALAWSNDNKSSVWKKINEDGLITKKQADTLEMCSKGYIPLKVAKVTISLDKPAAMSQTPTVPFVVGEDIESKTESRPSSLVQKIQSRQANTPIEDLYKSGEIRKLSIKPGFVEEQKKNVPDPSLSQSHLEVDGHDSDPEKPRSDQPGERRGDLSWLIGKKLGKFLISTQLGKGSVGTVLLAHHTSLNMPVAIKILDPDLATRYPELIDRFMHEAKSAARINHPNVIRILDCDCIDGLHMIVMEYVDGISLSELVSMNGPLAEDRALKYCLAVAEGLEAAVKVGIIHRDIKPANILITRNRQIRIGDMGLARAVSEESVADTSHGVGPGTPQYFPPEQARGASTADHRSDIYALGITLYVLLSGELPFKGRTVRELVRQHEEEYAIPLNVLNPSITQRTANLVIRMIEKNPKDRFQKYDELIQAIQACVVECQTRGEDLGTGSSPSSVSVLDKIGDLFSKKK